MLLALTALLFSCETTKETVASSNCETSGGRNTTNTEKSIAVQRSKMDTRTNEANRNELMYKEIGMNQNQIRQYEDFWKQIENPNRGRSNQGISEAERMEHQNKIMKEILNDSQFQKYQKWIRKEAER